MWKDITLPISTNTVTCLILSSVKALSQINNFENDELERSFAIVTLSNDYEKIITCKLLPLRSTDIIASARLVAKVPLTMKKYIE